MDKLSKGDIKMDLGLEPEVTNQDEGTPEVAPEATNPEVTPEPEVTEKAVETPPETPTEELYTLRVDGKEEKLPLDKVLSYAQQGRHYAQKVGQYNQELERKATELSQAALERWKSENKPATPESPATPEGEDPLEEDEFTKITKSVERLEKAREQDKFEKEVGKVQTTIKEQLSEAKDKFPYMNDQIVLATLRHQPDADIMALAEMGHKDELAKRATWEKNYLAEAEKRGRRGAEGAGGVIAGSQPKKLVLGKDTLEAAQEYLANNE